MFGLKIFVQVQTFWRGPPFAPVQLLPPCGGPKLISRTGYDHLHHHYCYHHHHDQTSPSLIDDEKAKHLRTAFNLSLNCATFHPPGRSLIIQWSLSIIVEAFHNSVKIYLSLLEKGHWEETQQMGNNYLVQNVYFIKYKWESDLSKYKYCWNKIYRYLSIIVSVIRWNVYVWNGINSCYNDKNRL